MWRLGLRSQLSGGRGKKIVCWGPIGTTHETVPKEQTKAKMAASSEMVLPPLRWEMRGFSLQVGVV